MGKEIFDLYRKCKRKQADQSYVKLALRGCSFWFYTNLFIYLTRWTKWNIHVQMVWNNIDQYNFEKILALHVIWESISKQINILPFSDLYLVSFCWGLPPRWVAQPDTVFLWWSRRLEIGVREWDPSLQTS